MYMKSVCFSAFILHISGTDRCKISVRYLIFRPMWMTSSSHKCYSMSFPKSKGFREVIKTQKIPEKKKHKRNL
jgi:hypothetical protein